MLSKSTDDENRNWDGSENIEKVRFEEDDNVVEIGVTEDKGEFPSKAEISSDESDEGEEGELIEDDQENEIHEQLSNQAKIRKQSSSPVHRVVKKSRKSVEDQAEELSLTVKAMKEMMKEKGILNKFEQKTEKSIAGRANLQVRQLRLIQTQI